MNPSRMTENIEYPYEAREIGEEAVVRAVILFSPDYQNMKIKVAKGTNKLFAKALKQASKKLDIRYLIGENYQGRQVIPIKVRFKVD